MLYAFGSNGSGQLGIGHQDDVSVPTRALFPPEMKPPESVRVAAGGNHTIVLSSSGQIHVTGENSNGRCGLDATTAMSDTCFNTGPICNGQDSFKFCSATWEASTFVTQDNSVFTCGTGNRGELGQGHNKTMSLVPEAILDFPPPGTEVVDLSACMSHTVAVLSNGDVYGWGDGRKGQIGQPAVQVWTPRKIHTIGFEAVRAVCGRQFTYIVGDLTKGKGVVLGSDKWSVISAAPKSLPPWKDVGASWGSIFVLLDSGDVLAWGRNDHGQLPPPTLPMIDQMAVGSEHVIVKTTGGKVLAWGWGEHGNCGSRTGDDGDVKDTWNEVPVPDEVVALGAGCATSWVSKRSGHS
ncbi:regulator of chromosome condensation 1/beta-lactamase-inhibitor protein II [Cryomyces antarcticus]